MRLTTFAAAAAFFAVLTAAAHSPAYLIDKVAAVVNGHVITKSEVDRAANLEAVRRGVSSEEELSGLRREVLDSLVDRMLLLQEARKLKLVTVSEDEIDKALNQVKRSFGSEDEYKAALAEDEMTEDDLRQDLKEQILASKYVDRRVRFFVRVTLGDQKRYYEQNAAAFGSKSFSEVHDEIYSLLVELETNKKLKEYLLDLRKRSVIVVKDADSPGLAPAD